MNPDLLFDPLFFWPCLTGLVFALLLPVLGAYLRLRGEWLAALAYAQMAAAGGLAATALGLPLVLGGPGAAFIAAGVKNAFEQATEATRGAAYAMLLLAGWGVAILLAANLPLAERLGHALADGQLYFTDQGHFLVALGGLALALPLLARLSRPLLLSHFYPDFYRARGLSARRLHLGFDLLVAGLLALATTSVGVMAAFALVFIPPLAAAPWCRSWTRSLSLGAVFGAAGHLLAFALALGLDQPYGPVLGLILVALGGGSALLASGRRLRRTAAV